MEIILLNRQRQHKLNLKKIRLMTEKLSQAVLVDLKQDKPNWLHSHVLALLKESSLSLIIVSNQAIRKLNKKWLTKDYETDVLSFPLIDISTLHRPSTKSAKGTFSLLDLPKEQKKMSWQLGEIFIAYQKACQQAKEYNHSIDRELAFLFVHGLLHILGFDHQDSTSEKEMFDRQRRILNQSGYSRIAKINKEQ